MKQQGFTLVELMVVIGLVAIFGLAAGSLTNGWVSQSRIVDTQGILDEAVGRAKAAALRNKLALIGGAAATLCVTNATITVKESNLANTSPNCAANGSAIWSNTLPNGIAVKFGGATLNCIEFDTRANILATPGCATAPLTLELSAGTQRETIRFN